MMFLAALSVAAASVGAAAADLTMAGPAPAASQPAGPLSFDGARLGMTVGEWKALSPPPGVGPSAAADCGPGIAAALRDEGIAATTPAADHATCAYDTRFGPEVLLHSAKLDGRYRIDGLRYRFAGGRLAEVDFTASVDAYNDIAAMLTRSYGAPTSIVRDVLSIPAGRFARVRETWRSTGGVIGLADPTNDPLRLSVRIGAPDS